MSKIYNTFRRFVVFLLAVLLLPALAAAAELELQSFQITPNRDGSETIEIDLSQSAKSSAFLLPAPPRVVVDLPTFRWSASNESLQHYQGRLISHVRFARNSDTKSRIVLELRTDAKVERQSPITSEKLKLTLRPTGVLPPPIAQSASAAPTQARPPAIQRERSARTRMEDATGKDETEEAYDLAPKNLAAPKVAASKSSKSKPVAEPQPEPAPPPKADTNSTAPRPLIIIDAGHGGQDPGASGVNGAQEKMITLAYAKELKRQLEATGRYRAKLTRESDFFIPLRGRVDIARKAKGNMFLSIHADSAPGAEARGLSMYTLSNTASDKESAKLAARENKADIINGVDLSGASKDVTDILIELALRNSMARSATLAQNLIGGMKAGNVNMLDHPHRTAGFAVLKAPDMPSALIEIGFLSHPQEEASLQTDSTRARIAGAIVKGIDSYFARTTTADKP